MRSVAYITNQFPSPVEPYVVEEIRELRGRGVTVIACSARRPHLESLDAELNALTAETLYLRSIRVKLMVLAAWLCIGKSVQLGDLYRRILLQGSESPLRRFHALLHTWLGVYLALLLKDSNVEHIHVHHGYFSSWIAMVAARILGVSFSLTLHGSDVLLHAAYLDTKLKHCKFAITVSTYNRKHILEHYPTIAPDSILVQRLGVDPQEISCRAPRDRDADSCTVILSVGRLHPVKDHAFLLKGCRQLKDHGTNFLCLIAGEGPERARLEGMIRDLDLSREVELLGQLSRAQLDSFYSIANLAVLTSRSEGVPVALMEAMSHGCVVVAPDITGIPELVEDGKTGFLYKAGSLAHFVERVERAARSQSDLEFIRQAALRHVHQHYHRGKNLKSFAEVFLGRVFPEIESNDYEDFILQQI